MKKFTGSQKELNKLLILLDKMEQILEHMEETIAKTEVR